MRKISTIDGRRVWLDVPDEQPEKQKAKKPESKEKEKPTPKTKGRKPAANKGRSK